jgi:ABC-type molybdate transport system ATPase subunit
MKLALRGLRVACHGFEACYDLALQGQATALYGPSGSGKTTLLEAVAGLRPSQGRITLDGAALQEPGHCLPAQARGIGYVPQDLALFPHLDVRANLRYGLRGRGGLGPGLDEVAKALGLAGLLGARVTRLSGGEQRRVALARALLAGPKLLLLDEPTANLDPALKAQVAELLKGLSQRFKVPFILVSHDAREIAGLCGQVARLEQGRCVALGRPKKVLELDRPASPARAKAKPLALKGWLDAMC